MGSLKLLTLAGALASMTATAAMAGDLPPPVTAMPEPPAEPASYGDDTGLYLRGDIGAGINVVNNLSVRDNGGGTTGIRTYDEAAGTSLIAGVGVGYAFNSWLRFDVTGEYRGSARVSGRDRYTGGAGGYNLYDGDWSSAVAMGNAYVDLGTFCQLGCITPYVGAGVGYAYHWLDGVQDIGFTGGGAPTAGYGSEAGGGLAWALMAGLGYKINDKLTLDLGYRYMNFGDLPRVDIANVTGGDGGSVEWQNVSSHDIRLGMRWTLDGGDCCGAAPSEPLIRKY